MDGVRGGRRLKERLIWTFLFLLIPSAAFGRQDLVPGSRFVTARGAALGDAYLPLGEDGASGLFYNPALLGKIRYAQLEPFNFYIQGNHDFFDSLDTNSFNIYNLKAFSSTLVKESNQGKYFGSGAGIFPNFFFRGAAFGVLLQSQTLAMSDGETVYYKSKYQLIPTVGGAIRLAGGVMRIGYSLQFVNEASGEGEAASTDEDLAYNERLYKGSGISHNLGVAITLPITLLPSLNVVARNVLGVQYQEFSLTPFTKNALGVLPDEEMTVDASFSIQPKIGAGTSLNVVLEYRDATNTSAMSNLGKLAVGIELSFRNSFFVRGGWGSGYPHAGFGLKRTKAEVSFAWTSEEIGTGYQNLRDTRYLLHYQVRAF